MELEDKVESEGGSDVIVIPDRFIKLSQVHFRFQLTSL